MRHLGYARPDAIVHIIHVDPPGIGELLPDSRIGHILIAGEHIRQNAHIAGALNIVLPAHGTDTDGRAAEVAGQQCQAGKPFDDIDGLAKLSHAHSPHYGGGRGRREGAHCLTNVAGGDAGEVFYALWGILFHRLPIGLKSFGKPRDVVLVVQLFFQKHIAKGVHQRHVATVLQLQMLIGNARRFDAARVADDNFRAVFTGF